MVREAGQTVHLVCCVSGFRADMIFILINVCAAPCNLL